MANAHFTSAAEAMLSGAIDFDTAVIKCAFVRGYTFSAAHVFMSDVTGAGGTLNGTSAALAGKSVTGGVFDADNTVVPTTASGSDHVLILFQASAVTGGADVAASAQRLIYHFDTGSGLPVQPGTGDTPVTWSDGASKILKVG